MAGHFKQKSKAKQDIPTASLPDIIFMLLIFFMVTTVLRETTVQVRTILPKAEALTKIDQKRLVTYLWIGPKKLPDNAIGETGVQIDDALVEDLSSVRSIMYRKLVEQPKLIVSLRVDGTSEMGILMDVQQELREAGTLRVNFSTKRDVVL
ncbi:MAG: biopolymer transporter ExbD [Bacteroidetes bacterium]|nr:biopolymer transporter ExbD [Bacteroidota bacterium]MCH8245273.1 biopolymer transporter ExbD [Bacteroidota bacterium]MCZ6705062.1 biopolymer transporter ExbD [Bacteroidota bacterium]MCZ6757272.1 biopolymer transporter ExbD [Bacteroidota bacterium]